MKRTLLPVVALVLALGALAPRASAAVDVTVTVGGFYDELAPYGRWVSVDRYGDVWCPSVADAAWQPYSNGEWVWTDYGWTWVSNDAWGADPYHYGSWVWLAGYGW